MIQQLVQKLLQLSHTFGLHQRGSKGSACKHNDIFLFFFFFHTFDTVGQSRADTRFHASTKGRAKKGGTVPLIERYYLLGKACDVTNDVSKIMLQTSYEKRIYI